MIEKLRTLLARGGTLIAPGAADALSARLIETHGFECVYIGSYATAASRFAIPDTGLLSLDELAAQARTIARAVRIPVIADAEAGFRPEETMRAFVAALSTSLATITGATVAARTNPELLIVARSDAFWVHRDLEDCIARLERYAAAGADMVFPTLVGPAELAEVRRRIAKPVMIVDMPGRSLAEHAGAAIVLYYAFSITRQFAALQQALARGELASNTAPLEDFLRQT